MMTLVPWRWRHLLTKWCLEFLCILRNVLKWFFKNIFSEEFKVFFKCIILEVERMKEGKIVDKKIMTIFVPLRLRGWRRRWRRWRSLYKGEVPTNLPLSERTKRVKGEHQLNCSRTITYWSIFLRKEFERSVRERMEKEWTEKETSLRAQFTRERDQAGCFYCNNFLPVFQYSTYD